MGNVNGREEGENGGEDSDPDYRGDLPPFRSSRGPHSGSPLDSMDNTPPDSPGWSRSPLMFTPQIPVAPLQRATDAPPVYNQLWHDSQGPLEDLPTDRGIPIMFTWNFGGKDVVVEGSWDNWTSRKALQRSGKDHSILLVLPSGVYQYRFIVDGEWKYVPDLPCIADDAGRVNNLLDVNDYVPENLNSVAEFEPSPSPDSSYSQPYPVDEDFAKEPFAFPPQLHHSVLGMPNSPEAPLKPQHVVLNHLFIEKGWTSRSVVALGLTHRFQSKYVTVVLYKPLRR